MHSCSNSALYPLVLANTRWPLWQLVRIHVFTCKTEGYVVNSTTLNSDPRLTFSSRSYSQYLAFPYFVPLLFSLLELRPFQLQGIFVMIQLDLIYLLKRELCLFRWAFQPWLRECQIHTR